MSGISRLTRLNRAASAPMRRGHQRYENSVSTTVAECLEHARQCEWYAAHTNDEKDLKFLLRMAKHWTKLAKEKDLEIRAFEGKSGRRRAVRGRQSRRRAA
jgi:hypothetical protein